MNPSRYRFLISRLITALTVLAASSTFAGTVGKIAGTVIEAETGDPIIGAAVQVEGTSLGAAADINGRFFILNVPPGIVNVRCTAIGYAPQVVQGIQIISDQTATTDFSLETESLLGEEVVVVAERELIEPDRTFTTSTVAAADIAALPVINLNQVVEIQAGVVDGHFRGGRKGEAVYLLDGVSITDAYDNAQGTQVDNQVVEELQVISGTFNAEYGQAMSGVVNIVTKEGGSNYHGSLQAEFGDYLSDADDIFLNIDDVTPEAIQDYTGSLSGPVPNVDDLSFFVSGRYTHDDGWMHGQRRWRSTWDLLDDLWSGVPLEIDSFPQDVPGDNSFASMNRNYEAFGVGKLTYSLSPTMKLGFSSVFSTRAYRDYEQDWKYVPDGLLRRFRDGRTNTVRWNHTVSNKAFYELAVSNTFSEYRHYVFEDAEDSRYVDPDWANIDASNTLNYAGANTNRFRRWTNTSQFLGHFSLQANHLHLLKFGFDTKLHELMYEDINLTDPSTIAGEIPGGGFQVDLDWTPHVLDESTPARDFYVNSPYEFALYVQDKFELPSLIINAGLRLDYFDPDGQILRDPKDPNVYDPVRDSTAVLPLEERLSFWYKDVDPKVRLSPRIGIAYPMTDKGVFHFAYGHFVQRPTFERLYANPEWELDGTGLNTVMGNPDLKMEETVTYEFGFQQELAENVALNTTLFFRDIRNLVGSDLIIETYESGTKYSQYVNRSFGEVKGITLSLDKRFDYNFSAFVDYTYQVAEGDASDPQSAFNDLKGSSREPEAQLVPLDWDRRHTLNGSLTYSTPGPASWGATLLASYGSGLPYTPDDRGVRTGFENDGRRPDYYNFDLSAFKTIPIGDTGQKFTVLLTVLNLLDTRNENNVYPETGRADTPIIENPENEIRSINTWDEVYTNPTHYSRPRMVKLGVRYEF